MLHVAEDLRRWQPWPHSAGVAPPSACIFMYPVQSAHVIVSSSSSSAVFFFVFYSTCKECLRALVCLSAARLGQRGVIKSLGLKHALLRASRNLENPIST